MQTSKLKLKQKSFAEKDQQLEEGFAEQYHAPQEMLMQREEYTTTKQTRDEMRRSEQENAGHKDTDSYIEVKNASQTYYAYLMTTVTAEGLDAQITRLHGLYLDLISACDAYLATHQGFRWSSVGRKRQQLVGTMRENAMRENTMLDNGAGRILAALAQGADMSWATAIAEFIKPEEIQLVEGEYSELGAGSSDVLKLKPQAGPVRYFKEQSTMMTTEEGVIEHEEQWERRLRNNPNLTEEQKASKIAARGSLFSLVSNSERLQAMNGQSLRYLQKLQAAPDQKQELLDSMFMQPLIKAVEVEIPKQLQHYKDLMAAEKSEDKPSNSFRSMIPLTEKDLAAKTTLLSMVRSNPELLEEFVDILLSYHRAETNENVVGGVSGIEMGREMTIRNVATGTMADLIGVGDVVAKSKMVNLVMPDQQTVKRGIAMEEARGVELGKIPDDILMDLVISPEFVKQLESLQVLDWICGQTDRNQRNYLLDLVQVGDHYEVRGLKGIDHDASFGTFLRGSEKTPEAMDKRGGFFLGTMDRELAERILALTPEIIAVTFAGLLTTPELQSMMKRISILWQQLEKLRREDPDFFTDGPWDESTVQKAQNGGNDDPRRYYRSFTDSLTTYKKRAQANLLKSTDPDVRSKAVQRELQNRRVEEGKLD